MDQLVITGASGQLGRLVAEHALARVEPARLILVTRRPGQLADLAARGAQVRFGDFDDPGSLRSAFAGARDVLLVSAVDLARRVGQHLAAIDAAVTAGARRIIYTSMISPEAPNPAAVAPSHWQTETALRQCGVDWTLLRNSLYADYQAPEAQQAILHGRFVHNRGTGRVAYVARADCAAVAAAVLTSNGHENVAYEITGPRTWDPVELAHLYSSLGGRSVDAVAVDDEAFITGMLGSGDQDGHARYGAELVASFGRAAREGYLSACTSAVERLAGRPAMSLETVLREALRSTTSRA
jgi:NAD(P)H dehydrogenase (quinone)